MDQRVLRENFRVCGEAAEDRAPDARAIRTGQRGVLKGKDGDCLLRALPPERGKRLGGQLRRLCAEQARAEQAQKGALSLIDGVLHIR